MTSNAQRSPIINVCMVEDDPTTRSRLAGALKAHRDIELVFEAAGAQQMLAWIGQHQLHPCDVLLVDLGLPDGSGFEVIAAARELMPTCECLVITMFGDESNMIRAFEAGARGYLLKDGSQEHLAEHVLNIHLGGSPMSPIIARQLIAKLSQPASDPPGVVKSISTAAATKAVKAPTSMYQLTLREAEVLRLIARGYTYPELANLLSVSVSTIHSHVKNIYGKLAVRTKTEAVFEARQMGLLD